MDKQDSVVKEAVFAAIESGLKEMATSGNIKNNILMRIKRRLSDLKSRCLSIARKENRGSIKKPEGIVYGHENGFANIAECAVRLSEMFTLPAVD